MGHNDLGLHHLATGNLNEALKCFIRTRDYGTTARHTVCGGASERASARAGGRASARAGERASACACGHACVSIRVRVHTRECDDCQFVTVLEC